MMNCDSMMINGSLKAQLFMYGFPFGHLHFSNVFTPNTCSPQNQGILTSIGVHWSEILGPIYVDPTR